MIFDLSKNNKNSESESSDLCIIGGGTVGLYLLKLLSKSDFKITLVECGGDTNKMTSNVEYQIKKNNKNYKGDTKGRSFGLGGTSRLWGGQLIPLSKSDFAERPWLKLKKWPVSFPKIAKYFPAVFEDLGIKILKKTNENYESLSSSFSENFKIRYSVWIPFNKRNFRSFFLRRATKKNNVKIFINSQVTDINIETKYSKSNIVSIIAQSPNGKKLIINAKKFIICAGALESTRMLLELNEKNKKILSKDGAPLGAFFSDHISISVGNFIVHDIKKFNKIFAPYFDNGYMRSLRLELSRNSQRNLRAPSASAHILFKTPKYNGFIFIKKVLKSFQTKSLQIDFRRMKFFLTIKDIFYFMFWRIYYKKVWYSPNNKYFLQLDIEQVPSKKNYLSLSKEKNTLGRKKLILNWNICRLEVMTAFESAKLFDSLWKKSKFNKIADLDLFSIKFFKNPFSFYDIYHSYGTIKLGSNKYNSVVNKDLRLWAIKNCYICSSAVFPSSGSSNPGLTLLAFAKRLSDHIQLKI
jgi:choline dehydrogenase-like flavoprotein